MRPVLNAPSLAAGALHAAGACMVLGLLALAQQLLRAHQGGWAAATLALAGLLAWTQLSARMQAWRYVLPGLLAVVVFVVLPMGFTVAIGLTNYSARHLLSFDRATEVLLDRTDSQGRGMDIRLQPADAGLRARLTSDNGTVWHSDVFQPPEADDSGTRLRVPLVAAPASAQADSDSTFSSRELVTLMPRLARVEFVTPDGTTWRMSSLGRVSDQTTRYHRLDADTMQDLVRGVRVEADHRLGYWRSADGQVLEPGFRTAVGLDNYRRIFTDERFVGPFMRVFSWTVAFAALNTAFTFGLGLLFAVALNWEALAGRSFYRIALFLPYAVPAFISIPIFRGLFNENLGEINLVLDLLFGIRPGWFSDATLARAMVLTVNTWLGYPYMMILAMGLLKAIPADLYEASALAGAGPWDNLRRITLPLVARPMTPLLIASFAANFNNLTLIALLTEGAPDYLDTDVPVGATDLLASYTYRIAFSGGGQDYALACAVSTLVFVIVAVLATLNLRLFNARR